MKRLFRRVLTLSLCAAVLFLPVVNADSKGLNWYCKKVTDNQRPDCPFDPSMLAETDAFFLGSDEKKVYLTFDAGYENGNVEKICDALKKHNATGAFFVLKHFVEANGDLVKKLADNGNLICNHSLSHPNMSSLSAEEIRDEIIGMEDFYREQTGLEMAKFFRPPEGSFTKESLEATKNLGYKTVFWSVAYADWDNDNQMSEDEAMEKILSRVHNGAVILLHPTSATNAKIMDRLLTELKNRGYSFGSLEELA